MTPAATTVVQLDNDRKRSSVRLGSMETVDALGAESRLFGVVQLVLKYTGMQVGERNKTADDDNDSAFSSNNNRKHAPILRRMRQAGFFIIFLLVLYRAAAFAYKCDFRLGLTQATINQFAVTSWATQSAISLAFVGWWQYTGVIGCFCRLLVAANKFKGCQTISGHRHMKIRLSVVVLTTILGLGFSIATSVVSFVSNGALFNASASSSDIFFGVRALYPLYVLTLAWAIIGWFMALSIYTMACGATLVEIMHFNADLVEAGHNGHMNHPDLLVGVFIKHGDLSAVVHHLNHSFEVYAFLIAGSNIPCTIATIYTLIRNYSELHPIGFYLICFSAALAIVQLWALSVTPARIYDQIREAKEILYAEKSLWKQFDEKTYAIANTFTNRVAQANTGIGLWGFAMISKPLILTTMSLIVTYITLLLQFQTRKE